MAIEVVCGQCQGLMLVETTGVVVACPHCGTHLAVAGPANDSEAPGAVPAPGDTPAPAEPSAPAPIAAPDSSAPLASPAQFSAASESSIDFAGLTDSEPVPPEPMAVSAELLVQSLPPEDSSVFNSAAGKIPPSDFSKAQVGVAPAESVPAAEVIRPVETAAPSEPNPAAPGSSITLGFDTLTPPAETIAADKLAAPPAGSLAAFGSLTTAGPASDVISLPEGFGGPAPSGISSATAAAWQPTEKQTPHWNKQDDETLPFGFDSPAGKAVASFAAASPAVRATPVAAGSRSGGVPPMLFMLVLSYASALTLAFLYLWTTGKIGGASSINLPDLAPPKDKRQVLLLREDSPIPASHILKLGQQARFGNVLLTPLRVTRGPIEFVHYNDPARTRAATVPVLKMWLKFENASTDQEFTPLDKQLVLSRVQDSQDMLRQRSNNFVCQVGEKRRDGHLFLLYDLPESSEWDIRGQDLGRELKPGEVWETFLPTRDEDLSSLSGDLVWRIHFRKGYHPKSLRGVTTIVEVHFRSDEIQPETPQSAALETRKHG